MKHQSMGSLILERFKEHRAAVCGVGVILFFVLLALFAPLISKWTGLDPAAQDILSRYGPWSRDHWFGTDESGRDFFIRLVYGTRVSLSVAFVSAIASMIVGILVGSVAGFFGGFLDSALMRVTDALLALPTIPILIILAAIDFGKLPVLSSVLQGEDSSILKMILIFTMFSWMVQARLIRSAILSIREREFVLAAKISGESSAGIIVREILPNILSPVIVSVTLNVGQTILFEAALSFLGLGIQPPTASWGNMLNNALEMIYNSPSQVILPGFLIFLIVVSFNFVGDGLQDALDPRSIRR
jgi:peptide/nickel transport system permease protein